MQCKKSLEFSDENFRKLTANMIAKNYANVAAGGYEYDLFEEIIDHKNTKLAVTVDNIYLFPGNVCNPKPRRNTID